MTPILRGRVLERFGIFYARIALGSAFFSAVADRFGWWGPPGHPGVAWGDFAYFVRYVAKLNPLLPTTMIPALAWIATIAEVVLGIMLIVGVWPRWIAIASALLLALFGLDMSVSLGMKAPLDYSVFSASAGALLLALYQMREAKRSEAAKD